MIRSIAFAALTIAAAAFAQTAPEGGGGNSPSASSRAVPSRLYDFTFVDTDLEAVLASLSVTAGVDIVPAPDVKGKVNLKVTRKTWQEVLDILCNLQDLTWIIEDKYVFVMRASTYAQKKRTEAEKVEQMDLVAPLVRRNFQIRHAKAEELRPVLEGAKSSRGKITVVERNNAIIVFDTQERLNQMEKTLAELDVETLQIMITAKLVVVDSKLSRELGVNWIAKAGSGGVTNPNTVDGAVNLPTGQYLDSRTQLLATNSDAGTQIAASVMDGNMALQLNSLLSETNSEVLASPQISTMDHTEAKIFMGEKVSLRVVDANGVASTQLVEAGIKLTVTPHVAGDNRIRMELKPENNSYSYDDKGQPTINTQEAQTEVVVADGETVVIAGLTKNEEREAESGIPYLKDIPLFGYLFKNTLKDVVKKDLIIFVTPRIMRNEFVSGKPSILDEDALTPVVPSAPAAAAVKPTAVAPVQKAPVAAEPVSETPAAVAAPEKVAPAPAAVPAEPARVQEDNAPSPAPADDDGWQ